MTRVTRRSFLIAAGSSLLAGCGERIYRVAVVHSAPVFTAIMQERLNALGYVEGKNLRVEEFFSTTQPLSQLPQAAAKAAASRPDVIFGGGGETFVKIVHAAAPNVPCVMLFVDFDPVAAGVVASLAHPGGNMTGVYSQHVDLAGKRLETLLEVAPSARRVAVLFDISTRDQLAHAESVASRAKVTLLPDDMQLRNYDFVGAVTESARRGAEALLVLSSAQFFGHRRTIANAAREHKLPAIGTAPFADSGLLLALGPSFSAMYTLGADYIDRILRGRKPGDLAIAQVDRFELAVNMRTAAEIGIAIPEAVLRRADQVIR